jgi:hypothetical protein
VKAIDPDAELVAQLNGQGDTTKSMEISLDIVQAHPEANIFFGGNDEMALGALAACEQVGRGKMDNGKPLTEVIAGLDGNVSAMIKIYDPNCSFKLTHGAVRDNARAETDTMIGMITGKINPNKWSEIQVLSEVTSYWDHLVCKDGGRRSARGGQDGLEVNQNTRFQRLSRQKTVLIGIIALLDAVMTFLSPKFQHVNNFVNIFLQLSPLHIVASAANLLMITGNVDLSVGSVFAFCAIMHAYMTKHGLPIGLSIILCCVMAAVWGTSNGIMVGVLNVNPVIATMGSLYAARGFAYLIARWDGGANISAGLPPDFSAFGRTNIFGFFPIIIMFMVITVAVFLLVEKKTVTTS